MRLPTQHMSWRLPGPARGLYISRNNLLKSKFYVKETIFLVHVINGQEIKMDPLKLETMSKWPIPTMKKEVQAFLGFANYYRRFIVNYRAKAHPLIDLTKDVPFTWAHTQQQAFDEL